MSLSFQVVDFDLSIGPASSGLVRLHDEKRPQLSLDEEIAVREAESIGGIDYVFFRRFADGRSSQIAAYVVDNNSEKLSELELAQIHRDAWLKGSAPLLYVSWLTRIDILSCARGPDFWQESTQNYHYQPADSVLATGADISRALEGSSRFSALRLSDGTFWDDPANSDLAKAEQGAHQRLIDAVIEADTELNGQQRPAMRQLLLLTILIKYLEDRGVFRQEKDWFSQFHPGATEFFDVLKDGTPAELRLLLAQLEGKFKGDIFCLPPEADESLTSSDLRRVLSTLVEAKTLRQQRYLWEAYSFQHLPVEVLSHLYQRFAHHGKGAIYTPPFVASLLLDFALPYASMKGDERVLDPTCGSGIFLVGAFRRLVNYWRSQHNWQQPDVSTLKTILRRSLFGIELQKDSLHLTSFSLALAVCDFLQPNVIWNQLQFDRLEGSNLLEDDFFAFVKRSVASAATPLFDVVIGNPPFLSSLTEAGKSVDKAAQKTARKLGHARGSLPDNQTAYLIAEQAMGLLKDEGQLCLIQPSGLIYNEKSRQFQRYLLSSYQAEYVLDFTSIRGLFKQATKVKTADALLTSVDEVEEKEKEKEQKDSHTADTKVVALVMKKRKNTSENHIRHLTFRRTASVAQRIGFELDHYDYHLLSSGQVAKTPSIWKVNLLGGGRLHSLVERLEKMGTLGKYIEEQGWQAKEGYIAGETGKRAPADWLTGQKLLPSTALTEDGIDEAQLATVEAQLFTASRAKDIYQGPLVLIRENEKLQCGFWDDGFLAYKAKVVGIHALKGRERDELKRFYHEFKALNALLQAFCLLQSTQILIGRSTAVLKRDLEALFWPREGETWDLAFWEQALCDDLTAYVADYIRNGQNSALLQNSADAQTLRKYCDLYQKMLSSIYSDLQVGPSVPINNLICQTFYFGEQPQLDWLQNEQNVEDHLMQLVYTRSGEALRTTRLVRIYDSNVIFIVKPDRLRYWIASTAIRDADETFADLIRQGE